MPASSKPSKERTLPIDKDAFAERLWSAIKRSGLTYKETARRAQEHLPAGARISDVSVWSYAKGRSLPRRMTHVEALGKVLGIDTRELLGSEERSNLREGAEVSETTVLPEVHVEDLGGGQALVRINQQVSWPVALEILRLVKGPDSVDLDESIFEPGADDLPPDDE
jgi:transcriptional regulator with XRE-family HTH domain